MSRASDQDIVSYVRRNECAVITLDADIHALLAVQKLQKPSVVRLRIEGMKGSELADLLNSVWYKIEDALEAGALVSI